MQIASFVYNRQASNIRVAYTHTHA